MTPRHLTDNRLIELSLLEAASLAEQRHLASCAHCEARRAHLLTLLDEVSATAAAEADAAFPPERLARQQARILAYLQQAGRPARVIAFPAAHAHEQYPSRTRPATRWVAAAAVAGLVIGVLAGRVGHDYSIGRPGAARIIARSSDAGELRAVTGGAIRDVSAVDSDEELLSQIEIAINGPVAAALQPIDDLTPRAWDVR